jgi:hypothetical protein
MSIESLNEVLDLCSSQCAANNAPVHAGTMGRAAQIQATSPCSPCTPRFASGVRKERHDHHRVFDADNDAHRATAGCAGIDVDAGKCT